ncbi:MAG TPA: cysteine hydrolase [Acidimicrobiia bacterium]|nr:cysteine hydrolase [Acidimicrobiia bacterium]
MPIDITPHLDPSSCAVVNMECQENLIGASSVLPGLAKAAEEVGLVANCAALFDAARRVGTRIYYCLDTRRPDGFGRANNTLVHRRMASDSARETGWSGGHGPVVAPLSPHPEDVVIPREQGLTGFFGTGLDAYLRNTGVHTVIVTGVSLNIAVLGTAIEGMNLGYQVIVPNDCTASDPPEYADIALRYTGRNIALVAPSAAIVEHWNALPAA